MHENARLSARQLKLVEWLATPKANHHPPTQELLADEMGINASTIYRWKQGKILQRAVIKRARELIEEDLPEIYGALRREAIAGNFQHIKLSLELTGEYNETGSSDDKPLVVKVIKGVSSDDL